ncbi:hypothetical protein DFH09DRAFT_1077292 [Mycena vulgaris]|nr:hypothetical protein DFH09DRAFT_1077292 [Mycena vulgaris]
MAKQTLRSERASLLLNVLHMRSSNLSVQERIPRLYSATRSAFGSGDVEYFYRSIHGTSALRKWRSASKRRVNMEDVKVGVIGHSSIFADLTLSQLTPFPSTPSSIGRLAAISTFLRSHPIPTHPHFSCPSALGMSIYTTQNWTTFCDIDLFALAPHFNSPRVDNPDICLVVVHDIDRASESASATRETLRSYGRTLMLEAFPADLYDTYPHAPALSSYGPSDNI